MVTLAQKKQTSQHTHFSIIFNKKRGASAILEFSNRNVFEYHSMPISNKRTTPKPPKKAPVHSIAVVDHEAATWRPGKEMGDCKRIAAIVIPEILAKSEKTMGKKSMVSGFIPDLQKKSAEKNDPPQSDSEFVKSWVVMLALFFGARIIIAIKWRLVKSTT